MKNKKQWSVIGAMTVVFVVAGTRAGAAAQEPSGLGRAHGDASAPVVKRPCVCFASDLIGTKVLSTKGEAIGKIEDVVVHPGGEVAYAVLSFGGVMGLGDKLFAIPWGVLESKNPELADTEKGRRIVLPLDKERLKGAPGFDKSHWPAMTAPDWSKDIDAFYKSDKRSGSTRAVEAVERNSRPVIWKCSDLKGFNIQTPSGEKVGDIKEVAIDLDGRVNYVAVSVGGLLGVGDKVVAVPWDALKVSQPGEKESSRIINLATTKERLEKAPVFNKETQTEMCDPAWIARVYQYYSVQPYWPRSD